MDKSAHDKGVVGQTFQYWQNLYDNGNIKSHVINLRLINLKYAIDHNLITREEYFEHHKRIFNQYKPCCTTYKQCTLMDFGKALKTQSSTSELKFNQSLKSNQFLEKERYIRHEINSCENNEQNKAIVDNLNKYYLDKEQESDNQNEITKKSRKKRKKKKNVDNYTCNNINNDYVNIKEIELLENVKFHKKIDNFTKQIITPKDRVKIFVRQINKKYKTDTVNTNSLVSTKKSLRDIFSQILKKFKEERRLQCK